MPIMISGLKKVQKIDGLVIIDALCYGTDQGEHSSSGFEIMFRDWNKILKDVGQKGAFEFRFLLEESTVRKLIKEE